jgi:hypothetical protein
MKSIQLIVVMTGLFFSGFNLEAQSTPFLTNGLVAYWPFNGNVNDVYGTNNGTFQGSVGATFTADRFGNTNSALLFDGTDRVVVQDSPSLDPTNAITISAWFNANSWNSGSRILCKGDSEYDFYGAASGGFEFSLNIGATSNGTAATTLPSIGVWHHAVGTYDGTFVKIYIDGQMVAYQEAAGFISSHGTPLLNIGVKPDSSNPVDFFNGSMSDVAIYNRALTSNEVSELYQSFTTGIITIPTVTISGTTNQTYGIQYVTNLSLTNWTTLASNIVLQASSPYYYPDTNSIGQSQRFYRVVSQ